MKATVLEIDGGLAILSDEETNIEFSIPEEYLPKNKKMGVGSLIHINCVELPKKTNTDDGGFAIGGFIKNPPKQELM